eukprot:2212752-Pyramimonas_sp.AAC.1
MKINVKWPTVDSSWCPDAVPRSSSQGGGHRAGAALDRHAQDLSVMLGVRVLVGEQADLVERVAGL